MPILKREVERLTTDRETWKRRQEIFNKQASRQAIRAWIGESEKSLGELRRDERSTIFEIEELRNQLGTVKERQEKVSPESPETYWVEQQLSSLRILIESQGQNLESIRTSMQLHRKLLDELASDSLADTAKDRLADLWGYINTAWTYELTSFGDETVTVQKVVTALLILLAGMFLSHLLSRTLRRQVLRRLDFDPSAAATIQSLFYYTLLLIFGLFALNVAKVPLTAFTVLGGAVALGIGFGSQNIINNFISGLVMMAERPVKVGDLIQIGDLYGNIEHIGARSTRVRTGANLEIIVPNSSFLQDNVINFTLSSNKVRTFVIVGVLYGSPTVTVTQLLRKAAVETGRVAKDPPPIILFKEFGDNSLVFEVHFWIHMRTMMDQLQIESAVRFRIDQLFREEGITIAFPQRDVHLDTSSPLTVQITDDNTEPRPSGNDQ
ncbi:MAG: mechanosensitive ion channel [Pirellulales bacterium]|nr:mechanosensitive ion channel [Pirellulales bacterium]